MAVISANGGTVTWDASAVNNVLRWSVSIDANITPFATSSTSGWKTRVMGARNWSATVVTKRDTAAAVPFVIGNTAALTMTEDGAKTYSGSAIVESIEEGVDINTGDPIDVTVRLGGVGALNVPS